MHVPGAGHLGDLRRVRRSRLLGVAGARRRRRPRGDRRARRPCAPARILERGRRRTRSRRPPGCGVPFRDSTCAAGAEPRGAGACRPPRRGRSGSAVRSHRRRSGGDGAVEARSWHRPGGPGGDARRPPPAASAAADRDDVVVRATRCRRRQRSVERLAVLHAEPHPPRGPAVARRCGGSGRGSAA